MCRACDFSLPPPHTQLPYTCITLCTGRWLKPSALYNQQQLRQAWVIEKNRRWMRDFEKTKQDKEVRLACQPPKLRRIRSRRPADGANISCGRVPAGRPEPPKLCRVLCVLCDLCAFVRVPCFLTEARRTRRRSVISLYSGSLPAITIAAVAGFGSVGRSVFFQEPGAP